MNILRWLSIRGISIFFLCTAYYHHQIIDKHSSGPSSHFRELNVFRGFPKPLPFLTGKHMIVEPAVNPVDLCTVCETVRSVDGLPALVNFDPSSLSPSDCGVDEYPGCLRLDVCPLPEGWPCSSCGSRDGTKLTTTKDLGAATKDLGAARVNGCRVEEHSQRDAARRSSHAHNIDVNHPDHAHNIDVNHPDHAHITHSNGDIRRISRVPKPKVIESSDDNATCRSPPGIRSMSKLPSNPTSNPTSEDLLSQAYSLVDSLLEPDPTTRATADQAMHHSFFSCCPHR